MVEDLQSILFKNEQVLWSGKPDKFCFVWRGSSKFIPIALIWLLFDGFFIGTIFSTGDIGGMWVFFAIFFAIHLFPVWLCISNIIKQFAEHKNIIYAITDKRVILRTGIIGLDYENINYTDISNIRADVSVIEKMRNVGSIFITTSSGKTVCVASIPEPYKIYKELNEVFMDMKADIEFPNAYRPESNPGYGTKYTK